MLLKVVCMKFLRLFWSPCHKACRLMLILRNGLCLKHNVINQKTSKIHMNTFLWPDYFTHPYSKDLAGYLVLTYSLWESSEKFKFISNISNHLFSMYLGSFKMLVLSFLRTKLIINNYSSSELLASSQKDFILVFRDFLLLMSLVSIFLYCCWRFPKYHYIFFW